MKTYGDESIGIENLENYKGNYPTHGLTKREYFAALALQGLLHDVVVDVDGPNSESYDNALAIEAVKSADKLILALNGDIQCSSAQSTSKPQGYQPKPTLLQKLARFFGIQN